MPQTREGWSNPKIEFKPEAMKPKPGDRFTMDSVNLLNTKIGEA
jgi:hypothetical protein